MEPDEIWKSYSEKKVYNPIIKIDERQYKKLVLAFRADPTTSLRADLQSSDTKFVMKDASGKILSNAEMIRKQEKNSKERIARNNNLLELDIIK